MKNLKNFGEFISLSILEGKEHSFANKVVRNAQTYLTDEEQDDQTLYEKIVGWAINYYDNNIEEIIKDEDFDKCLSSIKPKIDEYRIKQLLPKSKKDKKSENDEDDDES